jgi:hypothetical protein
LVALTISSDSVFFCAVRMSLLVTEHLGYLRSEAEAEEQQDDGEQLQGLLPTARDMRADEGMAICSARPGRRTWRRKAAYNRLNYVERD